MKSVIGIIIVFIVLYIILTNGVFDFFAHDAVFIFAVSAVVAMLIISVIVLGIPTFKKRGKNHDEKK